MDKPSVTRAVMCELLSVSPRTMTDLIKEMPANCYRRLSGEHGKLRFSPDRVLAWFFSDEPRALPPAPPPGPARAPRHGRKCSPKVPDSVLHARAARYSR
jgi:hypothetical protein